ncbi:MAG TPA: DUF2934 domain-containing protein [Nitrospirae bacterium]|nr:DUF2934 domain-containing protein [Nitrospirota bacterium]HDK17016.1 DUF2934 domain-containing protein [Nitrospirota bacterium]HDK82607.1 DUF2934 domain-containing protein [Nitrospirota bacterium]
MKMKNNEKLFNEIARVAYHLFEKRGNVHGYNVKDWIEAEKTVMQKHAKEIEHEAEDISSAKRKKTAVKKKTEVSQASQKTSGKAVKKAVKKKKATKKAVKKKN